MKYMMLLFLIIFISVYGGLSYYIGLRGWQSVGKSIPMLSSKVYWIVFILISVSFILAESLGKYLPSFLKESFEVVGGYWMAAMYYLLLVLPLIDFIRFLNRKIKVLPERFTRHENTALIIAVFVLVSLTFIMVYGTWSGRSPKVTRYSIEIEKTGENLDDLKVVMVSDIHLGSIIDNSRLKVMVDSINELKPDIILIPGDIIDSRLDPYIEQNMGENISRLKSKFGVFASLGNHDGSGKNAEKTVKALEDSGIKVLKDSAILVNESFYIVGKNDNAVYRGSDDKGKDLNKILEDVDKSKPIILMNHQPTNLEVAEKVGIDLQVSGHTHRGQFFPNNFITSKIFEVDYGFLKKNTLNTIVTSGFGTWGPPIRIGSRSEIVEILVSFK